MSERNGARGAPKGNRNARKHGFHAAKKPCRSSVRPPSTGVRLSGVLWRISEGRLNATWAALRTYPHNSTR